MKREELIVYWSPAERSEDLKTEILGERGQSGISTRIPGNPLSDVDDALKIDQHRNEFFLCRGKFSPMAWADSTWRDCQILNFESIGQAAKALREKAPIWYEKSGSHFRRANLIADKLRQYKIKTSKFPRAGDLHRREINAFALIDENQLVYTVNGSSWLPWEEYFVESKAPPSRAYLKLWEAFSRLAVTPASGDKCLEIGASPGGWTWVLRDLNCEVWAVDRSPLAAPLMRDPMVHFTKQDGFKCYPQDFPQFEWIFSDVISYPAKLLEWVQQWVSDRPEINMICTIKFQARTDFEVLNLFKKIPRSGLMHLSVNKHELTWYRLSSPKP